MASDLERVTGPSPRAFGWLGVVVAVELGLFLTLGVPAAWMTGTLLFTAVAFSAPQALAALRDARARQPSHQAWIEAHPTDAVAWRRDGRPLLVAAAITSLALAGVEVAYGRGTLTAAAYVLGDVALWTVMLTLCVVAVRRRLRADEAGRALPPGLERLDRGALPAVLAGFGLLVLGLLDARAGADVLGVPLMLVGIGLIDPSRVLPHAVAQVDRRVSYGLIVAGLALGAIALAAHAARGG